MMSIHAATNLTSPESTHSVYLTSVNAPTTRLVVFTERTNGEGSELRRSSSRRRAETTFGETVRMDGTVMEGGAGGNGD